MKRPFLLSGLTLLVTIVLCETAWYYGFSNAPVLISALIASVVGGVFILSLIPDFSFNLMFKQFTVAISSFIIIGCMVWSYTNYSYTNKSRNCLASNNSVFRISDSVNVYSYNGYYTDIICEETGAKISLRTNEKISAVPDDEIIVNLSKSVDQKSKLYNRAVGVNLSGEAVGRIVIIKNSAFSAFMKTFYLDMKPDRITISFYKIFSYYDIFGYKYFKIFLENNF